MSPEPSSSKIGKSVGEKLRAARIAQHYTQSQLAAPDFSVSYISAIERGQIHPSLRALEILAGRLGLTSTQLLPNRTQAEDRLSALSGLSERDDDEVELILLEAQITLMQDAASQTVAQLEKLSTKRLKRQQQLQHRYLLGWAYYKTGRYQESEAVLTEAALFAKELNAHYFQSRSLNLLALTYVAMRNYAQALLSHQRCLDLLEETDIHDPFFITQVYMHLGQNYTRLDNADQALEMFRKALSFTEELTTVAEIQAVYWRLCLHYATTREYDLAILYAYKHSHLTNQETMKRLRSELYHFLGHTIMKGDSEKARTFLDEALQKRHILEDRLTLASLYTRNTEWYFARQTAEDIATAEHYAEQAYTLSQPFGATIITAEARIAFGRVLYAKRCYIEGDKHFSIGLNMLEQLGYHEELADESVNYAQLLEEAGNDREAFTYFRRAYQSRRRLGK